MGETFDEARITAIATATAEALEQAALGTEPWELALKLLNTEFPNAYFALVNQDFLNDRMNQAISWNIDPSLVASYSEYYAFINPYQTLWTSVKSGGILSSEEIFPVSNIRNSEFYNDWLFKAEGRTAGIGLKIDASPTDTIYLPMHSPEDYVENYARPLTEILTRLRGPLERAIRISRTLQDAGNGIAAKAALAGNASEAAFVVDHAMRLKDANSIATALLRKAGFVSLRGGRLLFRDKILAERLGHLVGNLTASAVSQVSRLGWDDDSGKWLISLTRMPADPVQRLIAPRAQILIKLTNLARPPTGGDLTEFGRLFHLTPAELRLTAALGDGQSLSHAASSLGITFETARQRLKQVFQKTGTAKQSELCVMLTRFHNG